MSNITPPIPKLQLILGEPFRALEFSGIQEAPFIEPHRHEYWEIVWCLDNSGTQSIDFIEYQNRRGRLFTISPGQVHRSEFMGKSVRMLIFSPGFAETNPRSTQLVNTVFSTIDRPPYLDCNEEGFPYLESIYTLLQEECEREACDWDLVESLLNSFLRYALRFSKQPFQKGEQKDARIVQLIELIELHYREQKKCQFYSDALALTSKRLNELVKADRDKTVTQLIHDRIILEANRELVFSTKTVKTIAFELGFDDPAYFSRFYRKQKGETPAEFRHRCSDSTI
ncbi:helix-turn-helix domain-containing protein [Vibrio sp. B181a]|uniref:helix-turn-helix domain-containing protein n=1 Tax=Vibrio sp. B181a TaxID=2835906 RepID=UPI0025549054|nr:helix-turn-helix domain-containing protein [Vibrio sp. B181a]MDK9770485.1 helix-turn-helix domain-containing protein [Vibrio sp. B181a]